MEGAVAGWTSDAPQPRHRFACAAHDRAHTGQLTRSIVYPGEDHRTILTPTRWPAARVMNQFDSSALRMGGCVSGLDRVVALDRRGE
jgi:hypothetical protein